MSGLCARCWEPTPEPPCVCANCGAELVASVPVTFDTTYLAPRHHTIITDLSDPKWCGDDE